MNGLKEDWHGVFQELLCVVKDWPGPPELKGRTDTGLEWGFKRERIKHMGARLEGDLKWQQSSLNVSLPFWRRGYPTPAWFLRSPSLSFYCAICDGLCCQLWVQHSQHCCWWEECRDKQILSDWVFISCWSLTLFSCFSFIPSWNSSSLEKHTTGLH